MKISNHFIVIMITLLSWGIGSEAKSQFVYLEGGMNYNIGFYESAGIRATSQHSFQLSMSAEVRPVQHFGFGAALNVPVVQFGTFTMENAEKINGGSFYDFRIGTGSNIRSRYEPDEYNYRIKSMILPRFFVRYYESIRGEIDLFIEGRLALGKMGEEFTFERGFKPEVFISEFSGSYPSIPAVNINHQEDRNFIAPGFQIGARKNISDRITMSLGGGLDFMIFDDGGFDYVVSHDINIGPNTPYLIRFESQAKGMKPAIFFDISIGYFF